MSIITGAKTMIGGAIAGLTLLTLIANPTLASTHNQTAISTAPSSLTNETRLTIREQISQTTTPRNQTTQQTNQAGCPCCKSMMNNMQGMMGGQNSQSGQGRMNRTTGQ